MSIKSATNVPYLSTTVKLPNIEKKALAFFLNKGRLFNTLVAGFSMILMPFLSLGHQCNYKDPIGSLVIVYYGVAIIALVKDFPLIIFIIKEFTCCMIKKRRHPSKSGECWTRGRLLLSSLLGYDLSRKSGAKVNMIEKAEDFWSEKITNKEEFTKYVRNLLTSFNDKNNVEDKFKLQCYLCLFFALHKLELINKRYYYKRLPRPVAIERFLISLGEEFTYSKQSLVFRDIDKNQAIITNDTIRSADNYIEYLISEIKKQLKIK